MRYILLAQLEDHRFHQGKFLSGKFLNGSCVTFFSNGIDLFYISALHVY